MKLLAKELGAGYWDQVWGGGLIPWLEEQAVIARGISKEISQLFEKLVGEARAQTRAIWDERVRLLMDPGTHVNEAQIKQGRGKAANRWVADVTIGAKS